MTCPELAELIQNAVDTAALCFVAWLGFRCLL